MGGHRRADQVGASTAALTTFKVTVTGGGTTFARIQGGHCSWPDTWSSRASATEACFDKDLIEPSASACAFTRPELANQRLHAGCHFTAFGDLTSA